MSFVSTREAAARAGTHVRQVEQWATYSDVLRPTFPAKGSGTRHRWTDDDVRALRVAVLVHQWRADDDVRRAVDCFRVAGCPMSGYLVLGRVTLGYIAVSSSVAELLNESDEALTIVDLSVVSACVAPPRAGGVGGSAGSAPRAAAPSSRAAPSVPDPADRRSGVPSGGRTPVPSRDVTGAARPSAGSAPTERGGVASGRPSDHPEGPAGTHTRERPRAIGVAAPARGR